VSSPYLVNSVNQFCHNIGLGTTGKYYSALIIPVLKINSTPGAQGGEMAIWHRAVMIFRMNSGFGIQDSASIKFHSAFFTIQALLMKIDQLRNTMSG
jgi:hypothetical protein